MFDFPGAQSPAFPCSSPDEEGSPFLRPFISSSLLSFIFHVILTTFLHCFPSYYSHSPMFLPTLTRLRPLFLILVLLLFVLLLIRSHFILLPPPLLPSPPPNPPLIYHPYPLPSPPLVPTSSSSSHPLWSPSSSISSSFS